MLNVRCNKKILCSYLIDGFGSRYTWKTHIMLGLSPQNLKLLPVDFHLKWVVFDLIRGLRLSNLVCNIPLFRCLTHLQHTSGALSYILLY